MLPRFTLACISGKLVLKVACRKKKTEREARHGLLQVHFRILLYKYFLSVTVYFVLMSLCDDKTSFCKNQKIYIFYVNVSWSVSVCVANLLSTMWKILCSYILLPLYIFSYCLRDVIIRLRSRLIFYNVLNYLCKCINFGVIFTENL